MGDYAFFRGTAIALEANPAIYGTNFVNMTSEAISLIEKAGSDGFKLNLDVGTMIQNGEEISVLRGNSAMINHIHISEPFLKKIEKRELHHELLDFLRTENFTGFISIEMGFQKNVSEIESALRYVEDIAE